LELPSPASGTVSEILVEEGDTVTVGQVIARIALDGAAPEGAAVDGAPAEGAVARAATKDGRERAPADGKSAAEEATPAPADAAAATTLLEQTIDVLTPAAGESVSEGTILEW